MEQEGATYGPQATSGFCLHFQIYTKKKYFSGKNMNSRESKAYNVIARMHYQSDTKYKSVSYFFQDLVQIPFTLGSLTVVLYFFQKDDLV